MSTMFFSDDFFKSSTNSIIFLDKNKNIIKANPSFYAISGYIPHDIVNKNIKKINSGRHDENYYSEVWKKVEKHGFWEGNSWVRKRNGSLFLSKRIILTNKSEDSDVRYIILSDDIDEESNNIEINNNLLTNDFITGLPHSFIFREIVTNLIKEKKKKKEKLAIILLDLVKFKHINESFGYTTGDHFLNVASERIQQNISEDSLICRIGGDIFAICLKNVQNEKDITHTVDKIIDSFKKEPFIFRGEQIFLSLNMGVALYPTDGVNVKELFKSADLARYRSKETGPNTSHFYMPSLNARVFEKLVLETNLRKALDEERLILFYQPQVDIKTNKVVGFEALIRWQHPELGTISPAQFIPAAEDSGLIIPIGKWVFKEACKQIKTWKDKGLKPVKVSVNISPKQLMPSLIDDVIYSLNLYEVDPSLIEVEVTETAVMKNVEDAIFILRELEKIGIKISIDDFGTGYSSLNYLAKLPLHALKIDRSFIQNVSISKEASTIVSTVIAMAHKLNLEVIAEGVEKESDLKFLRKLKCEKYQGFYFSKPVLPEKVEGMLEKKQ